MVDKSIQKRSVLHNTSLVIDKRLCVDTGGNGTSCIDFRHYQVHLVSLKDIVGAIFSNGGIGKDINFGALAPHASKRIARPACVDSRAARIDMLAYSFSGLRRASQIGLTAIVGNKAGFLDKFVDSSMRPTVTRTSHFPSTVEDVLDREVDFVSSCVPSNFDSIGKGAQ